MYGYDRGPRPEMKKPVNVGDELDVTIEAVGEKGDGICKKEGFVLFVPNTKQGDNVRIRVTKVLRKVGFAEVIGEGAAPAEQPQEQEAPAQEAAPEEEEIPAGDESESFGEEAPAEEKTCDDEACDEEKEGCEDAACEDTACEAPAEASEEPKAE